MKVGESATMLTLRRILRDVRRDGRRAVVRKARRIPNMLFRSRPVASGALLVKLLRLWARLSVRTGTKQRGLVEEQIDELHRRTTRLAESESERVAARVKNMLNRGRLSEAEERLSRCRRDVSVSPEVVDQRAQLAYLRGRWDESVALRRQLWEEMDRRARGTWLAELGVRFISGAFVGHIGHLGLIDLLQRARYLDELSPERRVFVARAESVANAAYVDCWRQHLDIQYLELDEYRSFERLMRPLFEDVSMVRMRGGPIDLYTAYSSVNQRWSHEGRGSLIAVDAERLEGSRAVFERHGLNSGQWFVGLHVREGDPFPWTNAVDSDVATYLPAIRSILAAGGAVIRIGSANMRRLPEMRGLIDYAAADWKSPDLDVFVWSQCRFFVGTGSGPSSIPPTFGRPSILTNFPCVALDQGFSDHLVLPKRILRADGNGVRYEELLSSPFGYGISRSHDGYDWRMEDNTPEELEAAVREMIELTDGGGGFEALARGQKPLLDEMHSLGRTGRSPFPSSFIERHPSLFGR